MKDVEQKKVTELSKTSVDKLRDQIGDLLFAFPVLQENMDAIVTELLESQKEKVAERKKSKAKEGEAHAVKIHAVNQYRNVIMPPAVRYYNAPKNPLYLPVRGRKMKVDPKTGRGTGVGRSFVESHIFRLASQPTSKEMKLVMMELIPPSAPKGLQNKSVLDLKQNMVSVHSRERAGGRGKSRG